MSAPRRRAAGLAAVILLLYLGSLVLWRDTVPPGLNNDAAEEALRGVELLDSGRAQVMSSSLGVAQETLYLYAVAVLTRALGTTTLAIQLLSWATALACLWMVALAARRAEPRLPPWVPLLLAASSLWLFHYARAGVRAISAPFFALAVGLLLDRAERAAGRRAPALACGAMLGLSLYAYTACRVLMPVLLVYAAVRLWRARTPRAPLWRCYASILAAALAVSIPNLLFAAASPRAFLLRGGYVVRGGWGAVLGHVAASAVLPFHYFDRYRTLASATHLFDGVSAGLTAAGIDPVAMPLAFFVAVGVVPAWRRRGVPIVLYLGLLWSLSVLLLGFAGPSLTRLLVAAPALLVVGALGVGGLLDRGRRAAPVLALLVATLGVSAYGYFVTFATSPSARACFSPAATPIGERAHALAAQGRRVLCVVGKDANVVRYLTHGDATLVDVVEFYRRPFDARDLSPAFRPDVVLVGRSADLAPAMAAFAAAGRVSAHPEYEEIERTGSSRPLP